MIPSEKSLLGLPDYLLEHDRQMILDCLRSMWEATMRSPLGELDADLDACRRWFDPVAQGSRLRRELAELPPYPDTVSVPGPPLTVVFDRNRGLVTPEGRCAIDALDALDAARPGHIITESSLIHYDRKLAHLYRTWSRHRLNSVVQLLAGESKPLQIPAAGFVVLLLINRSTSEDRALPYMGGEAREVIDAALFAPLRTFVSVLAPTSKQRRTNTSVVNWWMLYEARRRLGDALIVVDDADAQEGRVWVRSDARDFVIDRVVRDLIRGHRARATPEAFARAFDDLVSTFRRSLPTLAGFGLVHERPRHTKELRSLFLDAFGRHSPRG